MMKLTLIVSFLLCVVLSIADIPDNTPLQLNNCDGSDRQKWRYHPEDFTFRLLTDDKCMDISDYGTVRGSVVWLFACHTGDKDPTHQNQEWKIYLDGTIKSTMSGMCLDVSAYGTTPGTAIQIWECTGATNQKFVYNETEGYIKGVPSGLCLDVGSAIPGPCDRPPNNGMPFCDYKLSFEERVKDIVKRIPLAEKIPLYVNGAGGVPSLNLSSYQWWSEALHGVAGSPGVSFGGSTPYATSFPQIIGMGASFDMPMVNLMAQFISTEARGMNHERRSGLTYWAPNVNIVRDPRWGRGQETPGEDPYLTSEYARAFVTGMQGTDSHYLKVSSCCKHYTAYDLEDWHGVDRHHFNAIVTQQDLTDTYMPSFKSCVEGGKASSLMCSYNAVNGVPSCANKEILTDIARNQWGFQGYITGDCGAVDDVLYTHHYTPNTDLTCKDVLEAGLDIDCGSFLTSHLPQAIKDGAVTEQDLDVALTHLFLVQFRLGMFDPDSIQPYRKLTAADVNTPDHQALALTTSLESMVLLKNDGSLPLSKTKIGTLAVIGPNGQATSTLQGNYYGNAPYLISPEAGIMKYVKTTFTKGCDIASNNQNDFNAACSAAQAADATVMVMGLDQSQESEGHDREIIALPGVQNELITKIASCSKGPLTVVIMTGGALDLTVPKENPKVNSILWVGYPGQSGGDAIAQTIFGDNNPAGRLPYTLYPADFINQVSMFDMNMRPNVTAKTPGRTYRFYTGTPVYTFGDGLSYTKFTYKWTNPEPQSVDSLFLHKFIGDDIYSSWKSTVMAEVTVTVSNDGDRVGDAVVLAFMVPPNAGKNGVPLKNLFGFTRIHKLAPGQKATVSFPASVHDLTLVDPDGKRVVAPGVWTVSVGDIQKEIIVN